MNDKNKTILKHLNSIGDKSIIKGLEVLEKDGIPIDILTDVYLIYKLSDIDYKPMYKGLNFIDRLRRVLIKSGQKKLVETKIKLKNIGAGLLTTKKIFELQKLGLDSKKIATKLEAFHFILTSELFSDKEKINYLKRVLKNNGIGWLRLHSLGLSEIPKVIFSLKKIVIDLELSKNPIMELPIELFEFYKLKVLRLENTKITSLPSEIENLKNLEKIFLEKSKLNKLPQTIGLLKKLRVLHCEDTKLSFIPKEIGECKNLERIILFGTKVDSMPKEIKNLNRLSFLSLKRTPFSRDADKVNELKKILPNNCRLLV